jgi:hypothetical protein
VLISILTVLAEHSRIGINSYALYGNGALIVPAILAPFAIYAGWTWLRANGGRALEMAVFVAGLHFGVGVTSVLEVLFYPSAPDITLVDAVPGLLLSGAIFVLPAALLAAATYWMTQRLRGVALAAATVVGVVLATLLSVYGIGLGILSGVAVAAAERAPAQRIAIGVALFAALVVVANLPFVAALTTPAR